MNSKIHKPIKKLFIIFIITFASLLILGHVDQNSVQYTTSCQGNLFVCETNYKETGKSTGYGFPFNDIFIHKTKTINGKTISSYKAVDWYNIYQNMIANAVIAAVLTLPMLLVYEIIHRFIANRKKVSKNN